MLKNTLTMHGVMNVKNKRECLRVTGCYRGNDQICRNVGVKTDGVEDGKLN
jgi:hypothetical protein